jgi:hypothetical protein
MGNILSLVYIPIALYFMLWFFNFFRIIWILRGVPFYGGGLYKRARFI